jgi:hypothetical protein
VQAILEQRSIWVDRKEVVGKPGWLLITPIPPVRGIRASGLLVTVVDQHVDEKTKDLLTYQISSYAYQLVK